MAIQVSVVIPTRGRLEVLRETVRRLLVQDPGSGDFEVIVADDGSPDATGEWTRAEAQREPRLRLVRNPGRGRAAARNAGLQQAAGEIVCFLDDDLWVADGFLAAHRQAHLRRSSSVPLAVMGRMQPWPGNEATVANLAFDRHLSRIMAEIESQVDRLSCIYLCSGNLSFRRSDLGAGALFDEQFQEYSFEDSELGYRLADRGFQLRYEPAAFAHHRTRTTVADNLRKCEEAGRSAVLFLTKHPQAADRLHPLCEVPGVPASREPQPLLRRAGLALFLSPPARALLDGALWLLLAAGARRPALSLLQLACFHRYGRSFRRAARALAATAERDPAPGRSLPGAADSGAAP